VSEQPTDPCFPGELPDRADIVIVGGGLAGLACARRLEAAGRDYLLLEAEHTLGGRVRTDLVEGFHLDRGFQVLLTTYPEARRVLDFDALELRRFEPGAIIRRNGRFHLVADPVRRPQHALAGLRAPIGSWRDKLLVWQLRRRVARTPVHELLEGEDSTTLHYLRQSGFSSTLVDSFFRPFFGGVFLEESLATSSRWFRLLYRMFALGDAAVPAAGMSAIPQQIAAGLTPGRVRLGCRVTAVGPGRVEASGGEGIGAHQIVLATEEPTRQKLLGREPTARWSRTRCLYFAAPRSPTGHSFLVLDGDRSGPIRNLAVMTDIAPSYAAGSDALVSVSLRDETPDDAEAATRQQLQDWFGESAQSWRHLRTYDIPHALPFAAPGFLVRSAEPPPEGITICGDDLETPSIQGALVSGRKAAESILR
jgi:phytoene dehydrogenase-like protein